MPNRIKRYKPRRATYNPAERFFNRLKPFRAIAKSFGKEAANDLAPVKIASARLSMRFMGR